MATVLCFGDSITWGAWDPKGGWVQRLREYVEEKHGRNPATCSIVYNLGVSGDTSAKIVKRFETEALARMEKGARTVFVLALGANDAGYKVPLAELKENVARLAGLAKEHSNSIIFLGPEPVDESKTARLSWDASFSSTNAGVKACNEALREACRKEGVAFVDVFSNTGKEHVSEDGLHLNSKGHEKVFLLVKNALAEMKAI